VDAPVDGEVMLPLGGGRGVVAYQEEAGRSWLVLPARLRHYRIFVGERPVDVRVPLDFDMDWVLRDTFFPGDTRSLGEIVNAKRESGELVAAQVNTPSGVQRAYFLRTGKMLKAGDRVVSFDILTGDQLFVDRMSYHFVRPQVGQGFVFRTDNLESRYMVDAAGKPVESYYIKRLVGVPGDTLRIADYTLYRNGEPITGSPAFDKNARRADRYVGYRPEGLFKDGAEVVIAPGQYLPLGDNSANSLDGRYWGTVAAADVVGRPLFIYYPFTNRWGVAP
jgi:signal peptidase I